METDQISWNAVGHRALKVVPNEFGRIEFRGIIGKSFGAQARMFTEAFSDGIPAMHSAVIPQEKNRPPQVSEQISQKLRHLAVFDVLIGMEMGIEGNPSLLRRKTDRRNGRDLGPVAGASQDRRFPLGRPSPTNIGDEQKAGLIQKDQVGSKPFGVFLYAAIGIVSNG